MIRGICLQAIALAMLAAPALAAENNCKVPPSPSVPDGKTASGHDLVAAAADVKAFMLASDNYQLCLNDWLEKEQAAADAAKKPLDVKIKETRDTLGDANQKEKELVGTLYNAQAGIYRKAHPSK